MNYVCRQGLYHDAPVISAEPSSDNGFIYTAYAKQFELPIKKDLVWSTATLSQNPDHSPTNFSMHRASGDNRPVVPFSRDEVIGLASLRLLDYSSLKASGFMFYQDPKVKTENELSLRGFIKAVRILFSIRNEHRTYVWRNRLTDAYTLAFRLAPADRYYVKKMFYDKPTLLETIFFYLAILTTCTSGVFYARTIKYLMLKDLGFKNPVFYKYLNHYNAFRHEFKAGHPIRGAVDARAKKARF